MSGNPVKLGDGCATVTGYELPMPLIHFVGKAGARFTTSNVVNARSQDTGLVVLVGRKVDGGLLIVDSMRPERFLFVYQSSTINYQLVRHFSVKEKDEASPLRVCAPGFAECLHSPF